MKAESYTHEYGKHTIAMQEVSFNVNDFHKDHPALASIVRDVVDGKLEEDLTLEQLDLVEDPYIKDTWQKARWVAENVACLKAADMFTSWGFGYRSDDGLDDINGIIEQVSFLTNHDISDADFMKWWDCDPDDYEATDEMGHYVGGVATDAEIRWNLFPKKWRA